MLQAMKSIFSILTTTTRHFRSKLNPMQIVESFGSKRRRAKRLRSQPPARRFWVWQGLQVPDGTINIKASLAIEEN